MELSNDHLARKDLLGRRQFAAQIVKSVTKSFEAVSESITIGISGKWGSGKSTLLEYIKYELVEMYKEVPGDFRIISFNPWTSTGIEDLQGAFLQSITSELKSIAELETEKQKQLQKRWWKTAKTVAEGINPLAKGVIKAIDDYVEKKTTQSVSQVKVEVDRLIKEKKLKIFLFIDDLDRLTPEEICSIFKVIKQNGNFLNTFYFIAYDKEVVIHALSKQFSDGESYLEKIIQVDFIIPEILEEQLEEIFFSELRKLLSALKINFKPEQVFSLWRFRGFREYFRTVRDIKRYFNSLLLSLPNIGAEVDLHDFLILEGIKVFDYSGYEQLYADFVTIHRKAIWTSITFDDHAINKYKNGLTRDLLQYLFKSEFYSAMRGASINAKRLKDPQMFERYYALYLPSKDVQEEVVQRFLMPSSNRQQILLESINHGRIKSLLDRLQDRALARYYVIDDLKLLIDFLNFWDANEELIIAEWDELIWHAYFNLASSFSDKFLSAKEAVNTLILDKGKHQPARFVFNHWIMLQKERGSSDLASYGLIEDYLLTIFPAMKDAFIIYLKEYGRGYFHTASKGKNPFVSKLVILSHAKYCSDEYLKTLNDWLRNSAFKIFFIHFFIMFDKDGQPTRIDFSSKDVLLPNNMLDIFISSLKEIKPGSIKADDHKIVSYFLRALIPETNDLKSSTIDD